MTSPTSPAPNFTVGDWLVQPGLSRIERGGEAVHVTPRSMALLVYLAEADGRVVSRNELLDRLWPRMAVTHDALSQCIVELRKAFRDDSRRAAVIETIPKIGIRLKVPRAPPETRPARDGERATTAGTPDDPLARAEFRRLTDFVGAEEQAVISRDGRVVALISDRDGSWDVLAGPVDGGELENLTQGAVSDLRNSSLRVLTFAPTGEEVLIWTKTTDKAGVASDFQWTAAVAGGALRSACVGYAEMDWSADARRVVYHSSAPGDPLFVAAGSDPEHGTLIHVAPPGVHCHYPTWSRDGESIYFVRGFVPDEMDIWHLRANGSALEQLTWHNSRVSHPTLLDKRTLLYLAPATDGSGPWLHALDLERGTSRRLKTGGSPYTSIAASADGRRLVATEAHPAATLWRVDLRNGVAAGGATQIPIRTVRGVAPRLGPGCLVYRAPKAGTDALWRLEAGGRARELWSGVEGRCVAGPSLSADGLRVAFAVQRHGTARLYAMNVDGSGARRLAEELDVRGAPSWSPDGQWIATAALRRGKPRLFKVHAAGEQHAVPLGDDCALDPAWSPSGRFIVYTGDDVGTAIQLKAVSADGGAHAMPNLFLNRGSRRLAFLGRDGETLVFLKGPVGRKDLWAIELHSGREWRLAEQPPGAVVADFDVAADASTIVFDRVREESHIVRIDVG